MDNKIYNNFSELKYGKVLSFDGEAGIIVTGDEEVIFSKKDLCNNIVEKALDKGSMDNISCFVINLN